jgi:beta-glucosidase
VLDHYRRVVSAVHEHGLTPMVTLNHFTLPEWVAAAGGWRQASTPVRFERYCRAVVTALQGSVAWYCTVNEPGVVAFGGYLGALGFPPGSHDVGAWKRAIAGLIEGHRRASAVIRDLQPGARVGATHSMQEWEANAGGQALVDYLRRMNEDAFLEASSADDFVGVQTYTRVRVEAPRVAGPLVRAALAVPALEAALVPTAIRVGAGQASAAVVRRGERATQMGYEFRPEAVAATIRRVAAMYPGKDIVVTEHGVATDDDAERAEFIVRGLAAIHGLIAAGVPVRGYVHWSLLDNFEWALGYAMKFGLVEVDRATQRRTVRPSARLLGEVARTGRLSIQDGGATGGAPAAGDPGPGSGPKPRRPRSTARTCRSRT